MRYVTTTEEEARAIRARFTSDPVILEAMQLRIYVDPESIILAERLFLIYKKHKSTRLKLAANMIELDSFVINEGGDLLRKYSLPELKKYFEKYESTSWYNHPINRAFLIKLIERKLREKDVHS